MLVKTNGIVLNYIKYGDSSIIVRIFTRKLGYGSYIVNSVRKRWSGKSLSSFQPFSILALVLYVKESRDLQRVSDAGSHILLREIHHNLIKSSITLFLTEVLSKLLRNEPAKNELLYEFLAGSIRSLDALNKGVENFHVQFLIKIAAFLGFAIEEFESLFTSLDRLVPHNEGGHVWELLMNSPYGKEMAITRNVRNQMLEDLISYYHHHANLARPKSLDVLRRILN